MLRVAPWLKTPAPTEERPPRITRRLRLKFPVRTSHVSSDTSTSVLATWKTEKSSSAVADLRTVVVPASEPLMVMGLITEGSPEIQSGSYSSSSSTEGCSLPG